MTPQTLFRIFAVLFQPLYFLMILLYVDQLQKEEDPLTRKIDVAIIALAVIFMAMQAWMGVILTPCGRKNPVADGLHGLLKTVFYAGLVVWFLLEVVLSYWWCFRTGKDPLTEHTPFVVMFLFFNAAQWRAMRQLGVLQKQD
eukprot:g2984.t1